MREVTTEGFQSVRVDGGQATADAVYKLAQMRCIALVTNRSGLKRLGKAIDVRSTGTSA